MRETAGRIPELEILSARVHQTKELIARLRQSNRALAAQLEEAGAGPGPSPAVREAALRSATMAEELDRLRRERAEIRERLGRLLEQLEGLEI